MFRFPASHKLKTPAEFRRVYDRKRSAADGVLVVYACEGPALHPRVGLSVSRKVGGAVVRNRYKRLFREAFRLCQHDLPSAVDFVLIPRQGPEPTLDRLKVSLVTLARQAAGRLNTNRRSDPAVRTPQAGPASPATGTGTPGAPS